ncbi:X2-like carbohydrate binding domain-containing protein, partial [Clostridium sp. HBUAS56017]|uniref:X2-like carbohydrate binding domain-containing protein n=1 Tax=Clostridium sp. HBUAS56017 TaxID=2571128 RepID=UPI001FAB0FA9
GDKVLVEGKDYTIVNGKVVLSKDYLSQFVNGQITLVFDFDNGNDPTLVIDVVGDLLDVKVGEVTGNPGDTVVVPVTVKGIQKDKGVYGYNFRLQYDTTKFENVKVEPGKDCPNPTSTFHGSILPGGIVKVLYMNSTSNDDPTESIGQDGVLCNVTMTIKDTASKGVSPVTFATKGTFQYMPKDAQKSKPYKVNFADGSVNIGGQPPVSKDAKLKETEVNFDQTNPADITVGVEYNGNTLKAIKNGNKVLVEGKDYTIVNGQVVLSKDYLSQFTGQITLVFDFDNGNDPTLIINVVGDLLDVKVADVNGNPGDTVVVPVTVKGIEKDKAVYGYNFRLQYDTTKFENVKVEPATNCPNPTSTFHGSILPGGIVKVLYMNSTSNDDPTESIGQDGVLCNITMTIKDTASKGTSPITFATKGTFQYMPTGAEKSKPYKVNFADGSVNIGGQPPVSKDAKLKETEVNFDQTKPADISVGIEYNNNTLKTITNGSSTLVKGEDYTEGSNGVVLSKTYLSKLPLGQTTLKFTFSNGSSETLTVKVSKTEVVVDSKLANTKVEFDQSKPADISVGIEYNGNTIEAIKNGDTTLVKGQDYTEGSNGIVLSKTYLGKLPLGQATLNFVFNHGNAQSLIVNVIKTDVPVTTPLIKTDAVNVKVGETFNVPVLIKNIPTGGILSASLNLNYDTSVLECTGYEFGSIIPSKGDADGNIIPASKFIGIGYMPIGKANAEIKEEGVFVTLKFKVKDTAAKGETAITEFRKTTLLDTNKKRVPVTVQFGKININ